MTSVCRGKGPTSIPVLTVYHIWVLKFCIMHFSCLSLSISFCFWWRELSRLCDRKGCGVFEFPILFESEFPILFNHLHHSIIIITTIVIMILIMIVLCRCTICKSLTQEEYLQLHGYVTWNQVCVCFCVSAWFLTWLFHFSFRRPIKASRRPRVISIAGRQSLVAFDQQDRQREGYRLPYRQRGGKPSSAGCVLPPPPSDTIAGHNPRSKSSCWQFSEDQNPKFVKVWYTCRCATHLRTL